MSPKPNTDKDAARNQPTGSTWRVWLVLFVASFALYGGTASRGIQWQDSGSHILRIVSHQLDNPLGLALVHPLHHWLCRLAILPGLGEPAFVITLVSSLCAALTVANVFGVVAALTGRRSAALMAAAALGLAHTFWQLATLTETYTMCTALLSGELWCLVLYARTGRTRYLFGLGFLNGLGIANHLLAGLTTPMVAVVVGAGVLKKRISPAAACAAAGLWLVGTLPYSALVASELLGTGDWAGVIKSALFGHGYARDVLNVSITPRVFLVTAGFAALSFPNLLWPAGIYGAVRSIRGGVNRLAGRYLLAGLIVHVGFAFRYSVPDQYMFLLPTYVLLCVFGGIGFAGLLEWTSSRPRRIVTTASVTLLAATPLVYAAVVPLARRCGVLDRVARHKPYRDDYVYLLAPWSVADRSAQRMADEATRLAGPSGLIVVEDSMAAFAVRYKAFLAGWNDLRIVGRDATTKIAEAAATGRPIVLVPATVGQPITEPPTGHWRPEGDLYVFEAEMHQ